MDFAWGNKYWLKRGKNTKHEATHQDLQDFPAPASTGHHRLAQIKGMDQHVVLAAAALLDGFAHHVHAFGFEGNACTRTNKNQQEQRHQRGSQKTKTTRRVSHHHVAHSPNDHHTAPPPNPYVPKACSKEPSAKQRLNMFSTMAAN